MIRRTRLKAVGVMAAIVFSMITFFCSGILITTYSRNKTDTNTALDNMLDSFYEGGEMPIPDRPMPNNPDRFNNLRGFTVFIDIESEIAAVRNNSFFTEDEIIEYIGKIYVSGKTEGRFDNLEYRTKSIQGGIIIAALDRSMENKIFNELLTTVLLAGFFGMLLLFVAIWFLSYWIVRPAAVSLEKQKRFISEAGHEIKTPLTVISAGIELLRKNDKPEDNVKWLEIINEQLAKMSVMTNELLTLSRLDEETAGIKTDFDLSQAVLTEGLAFESIAFERGKTLNLNTTPNIQYKGDYQAVHQAVTILLDNAIKYSNENGTITLRLDKAAKPTLSVSNTGSQITKEELPLVFERFYRGSHSRAECDGAGLGLSILQALAIKNKWTLSVDSDEDTIVFSIIF